MSCVSEGATPKRVRHKTIKGAGYSRKLLYSESSRILKRLKNQKELFSDLLQSDNVTMMNREVAKLDDLQNQLVETYTQIRENLREIDASKEDEEQLQNLVDVVDKEDAAVFEIKKNVSMWMVSHSEELEVDSVKSERTCRSANSLPRSHRCGRSGSVKSNRSRRSGSRDSAHSVCSDRSGHSGRSGRSVRSEGSRSSRVSRKAEVAGLKVKVEILKKDGKVEIEEEIRKKRLELDQYEKEQNAILQSEIAGIEEQIIQQDYLEDECVDKTHVSLNHNQNQVKSMKENEDDETIAKGDKHVIHVIEQMNALTESIRRKEDCKTPIRQKRMSDAKPSTTDDARNKCGRGMELIEDQAVREKPPSVMDVIRKKRVTIEKMENGGRKQRDCISGNPRQNHGSFVCRGASSEGLDYSPKSDQIAELSYSMMKMIKAQSAPKPTLDIFSGDPLEYVYFIENFIDLVESNVDDQHGRLNRLIQHTVGEAKELIKHCVHYGSNDCYDAALRLLEKEYGNPVRIACAYMEKLSSWPAVKNGDGVAFSMASR